MVNTTVVNNKNTLRGGIWIHLSSETIQILHKLVSIIAANFDVAVKYTIDGDRR
jgi:hypothetical protein